ncbi:MAG: hypothetical protein HY819_02865 [Acidobacteria bacterium]|nr:hypothetical protein [Acidobacteriota bacterium]
MKVSFNFLSIFSLILIFVFPTLNIKQTISGATVRQNKQTNASSKNKKKPRRNNFTSYENDSAEGRANWFHQQRAFPLNTIPSGVYQRAVEHVREKMRPKQLDQIEPKVVGNSWTPIGPDSIHSGQAATSFGNVSGRITSIAVCCGNSNEIYIGAAQGGVWKTTNSGGQWKPLTDFEATLATGSIAIDPTNPKKIYVGTGEANGFSPGKYFGQGILKSTNGGLSWKLFNKDTSSKNIFVGRSVGGLVISPSNPKIIFAGLSRGTEGVDGSPFPGVSQGGIFQSIDEGETWNKIETAPSGQVEELKIDPSDPKTLYATYNAEGIYKTTDSSLTWSKVAGTNINNGFPNKEFGRIALGISPSNPKVIYASVESSPAENNPNNLPKERELLDIYKSTDGGKSWISKLKPTSDCQCGYDNVIAVSSIDPNTIFFGGVGLYKSANGGKDWKRLDQDNRIHADVHSIIFDPSNPKKIFVGTDGGIWVSSDNGESWTNINSNLSITQFNKIATHPTNGNFVIGGTQDNGTLIHRNNNSWLLSAGGDGGFTVIDFDNPNTVYHTFQITAANNVIERSDQRGTRNTWRTVVSKDILKDASIEAALFYSPLVMDPNDSKSLIFGTYRPHKTTDGGNTWTTTSDT